MGLSSNILWHQTKKDALKKILKEKSFRFSYSLEHIEAGEYTLERAFPMLSLCDIPLADIEGYLMKYGGNSIGLSREWGKLHGITPVIYCESSSNLLNHSVNLINQNNDEQLDSYIINLFSHIKNHEGKLPKYNYRKYRFFDEREVRIIPSIDDVLGLGENPIISKEEYINYKGNHNNSALLPDVLNIPFSYNDIRYFILRDEDSISEIKSILSKEIDLAKSRISFFTHQQIREDFIGDNHNEIINKEIKEPIDIDNRKRAFPQIKGKITIDKNH